MLQHIHVDYILLLLTKSKAKKIVVNNNQLVCVCVVFMISNIYQKKTSPHCIYLFFLLDESILSRLHLLIRCICRAQNVVIVYYIVGAMGSYVEHNRTTTTSTVCYSLCWPVSSLFFVLFSFPLSLHRPIKATTSASWQRSSKKERVKINNICKRVRESHSFFFSLF